MYLVVYFLAKWIGIVLFFTLQQVNNCGKHEKQELFRTSIWDTHVHVI